MKAMGGVRINADGDRAGKAAMAAQAVAEAEVRISTEEKQRKFTRIDSFEGAFDFLDMDCACDVMYDGGLYKSARLALLAAQYPIAAGRLESIANLEDAKNVTEGDVESDNWEGNRLKVAERILRDKFRRTDDFRKRLGDTGDRDIVWENDSDIFFGAVRGRGRNHVGRLVSEIRTNINAGTEVETFLHVNCELELDSIRWPPLQLLEQKLDDDGAVIESKVHRLSNGNRFKMGKLPDSAVVALHPSVSREHAMILHTQSKLASRTGGLAIMDLGSKSGVVINGAKIPNPWSMVPLRNGDEIKLGVSKRSYIVKVDLSAQIAALEQQQRELMQEVETIDKDAADPLEAARRVAKEMATVFVGNLDYESEKADMLGLFQDCGRIEEVRFPGSDAVKGGSGKGGASAVRGSAFVQFDSDRAARRACGLNGEMFNGRRIKVAPANEPRKGVGKGKDAGGKGAKNPQGSSDNRHARGEKTRSRSPRKRSPDDSRRRPAPRLQ